ncbi:hypothetical protein JCM11491_005767 [Sporobolomyces phaffii]
MSAVYSIFTSPNHPPVPDHLPTLIVTPHGRPAQILYTYLHTNLNAENYLLTPSEAGDLCVAKLFPPDRSGGASRSAASSSQSHGSGGSANHVRCEASRNLRWTIQQTGIQNPIYKLTLPNPESPQEDQPLFQVSKPNPNATWWSLFYFTRDRYAGHLIPPKRVEFGRIQKNTPESGGGTRVAIVGKSDEEKAVWKTLGEGNEDMVEWIVICAALVVLDDEIISAAEKAAGGKIARGVAGNGGQKLSAPPPSQGPPRSPVRAAPPPQRQMQQMPMSGSKIEPPPRLASAPIPVPQSGAYYTPPPPHPVLPPPHGAFDPRTGGQLPPSQQSYGPRTHSAPPQQLPYPGQAPSPSNRAPSGYRPGPPRPGMPPPQQQPQQQQGPPDMNGPSSAARMVQAQVEAKRLQKVRR